MNLCVSSKAQILLFVGATRTVQLNAVNTTTTTIDCESGDMLAFEGDCGSNTSCEVCSLAIDLKNRPSGIAAVTFVLRLEWSQEHACVSGGASFRPQGPCPQRIPAWTAFGVIGIDVEARTSGLEDSGMGLFLLRDFPRAGPVTEYDGALRHARKVSGKSKLDLKMSSHWRSLPGCDLVIEEISEKRGLFNGRGGASLANHKPGRAANCKFDILWAERDRIPRFCEDDGCHYVVPRIVLYLLRPAEKGDELFVDYGEDTAKRFLLASPEHQGPMKLGSSPFEERFVYARRARDISAADNGGVEVSYQPMSSMHAVALLPGENVGGVTESASVMVSIIIRVQLNFILILFSGCGSRIRVRRRD